MASRFAGCPCNEETPDPCPCCGATVEGNDRVNGVCQAPILDAVKVTDAMVARALETYGKAFEVTEVCDRCQGCGYHHGFGEHGHDPDWCEKCGGSGCYGTATEESAMREALQAALA